jgi:uncharacterized membrane protein
LRIYFEQTLGFEMVLRSARERILQVCAYEIVAYALMVPLYPLIFGIAFVEAFEIMLWLTLAEALWGGLHDLVFDRAEGRFAARRADQRPMRWRVIHAVSREVAISLLSVPVIIWLTGLGLGAALMIDLGLTVLYVVYACLFFRIYDWLRPLRPFQTAVVQPS